MKILRYAMLALSAISGQAMAADLPPQNYKAPVAPVMYNWTGLFIGLQGGYGGARLADHVTTDLDGFPGFPVDFSNRPGGFLGGVNAGYQYQVDRVVFGLDGSWSWTNLGASSSCDLGQGFSLFQIGGTSTCLQADAIRGIGDIRGRLGVAFDRVLLYAAGGYAAAQIHTSFDSVPVGQPNANLSATSISAGWTVGGGLEFALTDHLILGAEYKYYDFGAATRIGVVRPSGPTITVFESTKLTESVGLLRLGYKF